MSMSPLRSRPNPPPHPAARALLAFAMLTVATVAGCGGAAVQGPGARGPQPPGLAPGARGAADAMTVGNRLMAAGQHEMALDAYHRAALERGLTAEVLTGIGSAELRLGRLLQAERHLRMATERDPRSVPAWNNLGVTLLEKGDTAEAARAFRTAFALDNGQTPRIRDNLALALAKQEIPGYDEENTGRAALVRRGEGDYLLLATP